MVNRPSTPEIITVNSETLQTQIRDLLPSQNGFGSELQASNVITPIIDLTAAAEGSTTAIDLARAIAFGSQTAFDVSNTSATLVSSPGFYRVFGTATCVEQGTLSKASFDMTDGVSSKQIYAFQMAPGGAGSARSAAFSYDFVVWVAAGITLSCTSLNTSSVMSGSVRQVATSDGTLVNPVGFPS